MERPPLGEAGQRFWSETVATYALSATETLLLHEVCVRLDTLAALAAAVTKNGYMVAGSSGQPVVNPAVGEGRQQAQALHRLLAALALPDASGNAVTSPRSVSGRANATARWGKTSPARKPAV